MNIKKLSKIKSIAALGSILFCTASFTGLALPLLPKAQLVPALLSANLLVLAVVFGITLLVGRIYCSLICPLGIYQDGVHFLAGKFRRKKGAYRPEHWKLRYGFLLLAAASLLLGGTSLFLLLDPYSIYGRMASDLWLIPWRSARGLLPIGSTIAVTAALLYWLIISLFAAKGGRLYCNTICPVGTLLGSVSRFALYQPRFNEEKCISCGLCERLCPSGCIDVKNKSVDTSRCVDCLQCVSHCPKGAITFIRKGVKKAVPVGQQGQQNKGISRRQFLLGSAAAAGSAALAVAKGPMVLKPVLAQSSKPFILPPGALSQVHLSQNCTACHLCISRCRGHVLRPFTWTQGIDRVGQPYMDHNLGHCLYDCHACSEACPTGAIRPITLEEKRHTQIGVASINRSNCLVDKRGAKCGRCAMKCPARAIDLVSGKDKKVRPQVNFEKCLGCGACHDACPADPKAINVFPVDKQVDLRNVGW